MWIFPPPPPHIYKYIPLVNNGDFQYCFRQFLNLTSRAIQKIDKSWVCQEAQNIIELKLSQIMWTNNAKNCLVTSVTCHQKSVFGHTLLLSMFWNNSKFYFEYLKNYEISLTAQQWMWLVVLLWRFHRVKSLSLKMILLL